MNKFKKFASLLLAMVMALALAAPAFAATEGDPVTPPGDQEETGAPPTAETQPSMTTITPPDKNEHDYAIYQIFTGNSDVTTNTLGNIKWGENGKGGTKGSAVSDTILKELTDLTGEANPTDTAKLEVIKKYVDLDSTPVATVNGGDSVTVPTGYYLIKDLGVRVKDKDGNYVMDGDKYTYEIPDNETLSLFLVEVVGPTTIKPKAGTVELKKKIIVDGNEVEENAVPIGGTVNYHIEGTLPDNYDKYKNFHYEFNDIMSKGLDYNDDIVVKIDGVEVKPTITITPSEGYNTEDHDVTKIDIVFGDLKTFTLPQGVTLTKDSVITVDYTATVNKNFVIGNDGNPNEITLKYSGDPNNPDTVEGITPKEETISYATELEIKKTDGDGNILTGAEFTLTGGGIKSVVVTKEVFTEATDGTYYLLKNGTYTETPSTEATADQYTSTTVKYKKETKTEVQTSTGETGTVKAEVGADGVVKFTGLSAGSYILEESKTPAGYNTIENVTFDIEFEIVKDANGKVTQVFKVTNVQNATITNNNGDGTKLSTTIVNEKGTLLPSTGGIGTTIFYIVGGVLAAGAVILLITKRRMNIDKD